MNKILILTSLVLSLLFLAACTPASTICNYDDPLMEAQCIEKIAVLQNDEQLCDSIEVGKVKESCKTAISTGEPFCTKKEGNSTSLVKCAELFAEGCEEINGYYMDSCIQDAAMILSSEELCEELDYKSSQDLCKAMVSRDQSLCFELDSYDMSECIYELFTPKEIENLDASVCEQTSDEDDCLYSLASMSDNLEFCSDISVEWQRKDCYYYNSYSEYDCEDLSAQDKTECLEAYDELSYSYYDDYGYDDYWY
ncbi:hypothetical protein ACFLZB_01385 [Nanoarchaeota archaeon]